MESNDNSTVGARPKIRPFVESESSRDGSVLSGRSRERSRDKDWVGDRTSQPKRSREQDKTQEVQECMVDPSSPERKSQKKQSLGFVDNRKTINMMPTFNMITQWGMNPMEGMGMAVPAVNMPVNPPPGAMPMASGMDMNTPSTSAAMGPYAFMGMPADPNMAYGMMGVNSYGQYGMMNPSEHMIMRPVKEVIHLPKSVLYPPNPHAPPPTTREKPPGCKTVFVGGLPEKITEEIVREIFEQCGEIDTIRMSKKNFCHIRFTCGTYMESAIYFSGYRVKIENKDEAPYTGRIHVDYAQARDDQHEYECYVRAVQREARHREKIEREIYDPPTPPPVPHYSDHESAIVADKLKVEETFHEGLSVLITWLSRGEVTKKNAGNFYSMLQSTNSHTCRVAKDKIKYKEDLNHEKQKLKERMDGLLVIFNDILKVFDTVCSPQVWESFNKFQKKNILMWKKQVEEIKEAHLEAILDYRVEDEMDVSEDEIDKPLEAPPPKKNERNSLADEIKKLREQNEALRSQIEASRNEEEQMKLEHKADLESKDVELEQIASDIRNLQAELMQLKMMSLKKNENQVEKEEFHEEPNVQKEILTHTAASTSKASISEGLKECEALLIGLVSAFLNVHPFGASIDYICSYLYQFDSNVRVREIESLMQRFLVIYKQVSTGVGARMEKKWIFCCLNERN